MNYNTIENNRCECLKIIKIGQSAAKYPNVILRPSISKVEGKGSTTRFVSSYRPENKGGNPEYL